MGEQTGIAGLPADGSTMVSGLPTAPAEEKPPPDWPLSLVMAAIAVVLGYALVSTEWGELRADESRPGVTVGVPALPAGSTEKGSYINPGEFREALDEIGRRTGSGARVQVMSVKVDQVWAVMDVRGRQRVIRVTGDGVTDDKGGDASSAEVRLDQIDPEAPQRIVRGIRERFDIDPAQIDFLSLAGWTGTWGVTLKTDNPREAPPYFSADEHGRKLQRTG